MTDSEHLIDTLDARVRRRESRRAFFTNVMGAAAAGAGAFVVADAAQAQTTITDADILNFALNLEYLEANFYAFAANGQPLAAADIGGITTGTTTGAGVVATGGRSVSFNDPLVAQYAREIAADELAHVRFLRRELATVAVAQPAIDLGATPTSAFSNAARAAGVIQGATATFDPYASDEFFLLGSFIFEDVGVTAYKGATPLLTSTIFREAAAGILAAEAYHAAIIRSVMYRKGLEAGSILIDASEKISARRDLLDGNPTADAVRGIAPDGDQGIAARITADGVVANVAPLNENGIAYSRTPGQTLNIIYLDQAAVTAGGFFPNGVNGTIRTSAAST